jgi:hypothetical protein
MKSYILMSIFFLLLVLPLCSAVQVEMKSSYDAGETIIAKISGNFLQPISEQNILFYRRHMPTVMDPSLIKLDNDYYIYAQISSEKIPDNYSIIIQGVEYYQGNQIKDENIVYNFSITNKTADFSINPGALSSNADFSIFVQNLQDKEISLKVYFSNETTSSGGFFSFFTGGESKEVYSFSLDSGETKNINFEINNLTAGLNTIKIKSDNLEYLVPVYVIKEKEKPKFSFKDDELKLSLNTNSIGSREILIFNYGNESIDNLSLSLSDSLKPYVNLSSKLITEIKVNSSANISLVLFSKENNYVEGFLEAEREDDIKSIPIFINFTENYNLLEKNTSDGYEIIITNFSKTCSEAKGVPCGEEGFTCNGTFVNASDDRCCVGQCSKQDSGSTKKIIGWSLLIICTIILFGFIVIKYLGTKNKIDLSGAFKRR